MCQKFEIQTLSAFGISAIAFKISKPVMRSNIIFYNIYVKFSQLNEEFRAYEIRPAPLTSIKCHAYD